MAMLSLPCNGLLKKKKEKSKMEWATEVHGMISQASSEWSRLEDALPVNALFVMPYSMGGVYWAIFISNNSEQH
jgi:hypothetical protein